MGVNQKETSTGEMGWVWDEYAPGCRSLKRPSGRETWLFGMKWLPTVGARSRKLLLRQLRRERVRWWAGTQTGAGTVGFLPPGPKGSLRQVEGRSAALEYAVHCPAGAHMLVLQFQQTQYWVVAVSEGNVLSQTDCWVESLERVLEIEATIRQRFGSLQVVQHDLCECDLATSPVLSFLHSPSNDSRVLLRRLRSSALKKVTLLGLIAICLFVWFRQHGSETRNRSRLERPVRPEARVARSPALIEISDPAELDRVVEMWSALPIDPPGWLLERISCGWKLRSLDCRATYQRKAPGATNEHLNPVTDAGWTITPVSIDVTDATRSIAFSPYKVHVKAFGQMQVDAPTSAQLQGSWLTVLQDLSAYTYSIEVSQPTLLNDLAAEDADRLDRQESSGQSDHPVVTRSQRQIQRRVVRMSLPMRHLPRIKASPVTVRWKSLHLEVVSTETEPSRTSRLRVYLEGDLIEAS